MITIYISIGNSDDKLPQAAWSEFYVRVDRAIRYHTHGTGGIHGAWVSESTSPYQNACWCVELHSADAAGLLGGEMHDIAVAYRQQIAWAEAPEVKFIG